MLEIKDAEKACDIINIMTDCNSTLFNLLKDTELCKQAIPEIKKISSGLKNMTIALMQEDEIRELTSPIKITKSIKNKDSAGN